MELTQLRQFAAVAKNNSIRKAAEELYVTSSALSKSIAKLEEELGVSLFDRTANSMTLNDAGRLTYLHAKNVFDDLAALEEQLDVYREKKRVRQALSFCSDEPSAFRVFVVSFMRENLDITISHTLLGSFQDCVSGVIRGEYDLAFVYDDLTYRDTIRHKALHYMPFYTDQVLLRVPSGHPLAKNRTVQISELDGREVVVLCDSEHSREFCENINRSNRLHIHWTYFSDPIAYQRVLGYNKVLSLSSNVERTTRQDQTEARYLRIQGIRSSVTYYVAYMADRQDKIAPFLNYIKDYRNVTDVLSRSWEIW